MMLAIEPGPAMIGMARGKTLMSARPLASASSAAVSRWCSAKTMRTAIHKSRIPPATWNAPRLIPNRCRSQDPPSAKASRIAPAVKTARLARRRRSLELRSAASARNIGTSPTGSTTTSMVRRDRSASAVTRRHPPCLGGLQNRPVRFSGRLRNLQILPVLSKAEFKEMPALAGVKNHRSPDWVQAPLKGGQEAPGLGFPGLGNVVQSNPGASGHAPAGNFNPLLNPDLRSDPGQIESILPARDLHGLCKLGRTIESASPSARSHDFDSLHWLHRPNQHRRGEICASRD